MLDNVEKWFYYHHTGTVPLRPRKFAHYYFFMREPNESTYYNR